MSARQVPGIMFDESNPVTVFAAAEWRRYLCALTGKPQTRIRSASQSRAVEQDLVLAVIGDRVYARLI